jgi:hypothetical protein
LQGTPCASAVVCRAAATRAAALQRRGAARAAAIQRRGLLHTTSTTGALSLEITTAESVSVSGLGDLGGGGHCSSSATTPYCTYLIAREWHLYTRLAPCVSFSVVVVSQRIGMHTLSASCNCVQCAWRIQHCQWWFSLPKQKGNACTFHRRTK